MYAVHLIILDYFLNNLLSYFLKHLLQINKIDTFGKPRYINQSSPAFKDWASQTTAYYFPNKLSKEENITIVIN